MTIILHQSAEQAPFSVEQAVLDKDALALGALSLLSLGEESQHLYRAAHPGYPGNFTRDSLIAATLGGDIKALKAQIAYSAAHQGRDTDPVTGRERGKVHHELPTVEINGASSAYNACDTTALFLSGVAFLANHGETAVLDDYTPQINDAIDYIQRHVSGGLFVEDPSFAEAEMYGLKVTYWKDSVLNDRQRQEPNYPIVYSLAHFQNADALVKIGQALGRTDLVEQGQLMQATGLKQLWRGDHFVTAVDSSGDIDPPSSDSLLSLLYIDPSVLPADYAAKIQDYMELLKTPAGYRTGLPVVEGRDPYHTEFVWTHEQALLHAAAVKHGLAAAQNICRRVVGYMRDGFPELIHAQTLTPAGNDPQLWAVQTHFYFNNPENALF